jgi:hypothetical protein
MAAERKTDEERLAAMKQRRLAKFKEMKLRDKEKEKILNKRIAKQETERVTDAGKAFKKLYKERAGSLELKDFLAICEKYWPARKEQPKATAAPAATSAAA